MPTGFKPLLDPTVIPQGAEMYSSPTAEGWIYPATGRASLRGRPPVQPAVDPNAAFDDLPDAPPVAQGVNAGKFGPIDPNQMFDDLPDAPPIAEPTSEQPALPSPLVEGAKQAARGASIPARAFVRGASAGTSGLMERGVAFAEEKMGVPLASAVLPALTLGMSVPVQAVRALERASGQEPGQVAPETTTEKITAGVGELAGSVATTLGVAPAIAAITKAAPYIKGAGKLVQAIAARGGTGGMMGGLRNASAVAFEGKSGKEAVRDTVIQALSSLPGMVPEFGIRQGALNFAGQVMSDLLTDITVDKFFTKRLTNDNWKEWLIAELPNLATSVAFAGRDVSDKGFEASRKSTVSEIRQKLKVRMSAAEPEIAKIAAQPEAVPPLPEPAAKPPVLTSATPPVVEAAKPPVNAPEPPTIQTPVPPPSDALAGRIEAPTGAKGITEQPSGQTAQPPVEQSAAVAPEGPATGTAATHAEGGTQKAVPEPTTTGKRYTVKNNPGRVFEIKKTEPLAEWESPEEQAVVLVDTKNGKTLKATMGDLRESVQSSENATVKERVSKANRLAAVMAELSPEQKAAVQATPKAQRLEVAQKMAETAKGTTEAGTKGVGAAAAEGEGEFIEGGQVTSLKKKVADIEAAALGRPEEIAAVRRSFPEVAEKVLDNVRKDPNTEQNLIDELKAKPRSLEDTDVATLLLAKVKRMRARNEAASETVNADKSGDPKRIREAAIAYELADKRLSELWDVAKRGDNQSVTATARGLSAMRMMADEDFNIVSMEMAKRAAANNGAPLSPEQKTEVQRVFDFIQKNPTDTKAKKAWRDQLTKDRTEPGKWMEALDAHLAERKVKLPDGLRSELENEFKQASRIVDESSRNKAVAKVIAKMMDHVPIRKGDWFDAYIYTNMLSGPMSHVCNILGNVTNQTVTRPLSLLFQGKPVQAGKYLVKSWGAFFRAWNTAKQAFKDGAEGKMMESIADLKPTASETEKRRAIFEQVKRTTGPKSKVGRIAWKALNTVGRSMGAMDVFTGEMIKAGEYARLVDAGKPEGIARQNAESLANDYLYRSKLTDTPDKSLDPITRALGVVAANMDKLRHADNALVRTAAKMTVPFLKTPANIAMFNNQVSVLGFWGANKNRISKARYGESFTGLKNKLSNAKSKETPDIDAIAKLEEQIRDVEDTSAERKGKATLGTLLTVAGSLAAASGNTVWSAPKDEKARKLFYDAGYKPYSFRVGDKWIPMMYLGPGMLAFAAPAAIKDKLMDNPDSVDDNVLEKFGKLMAAYPQIMFDQLPIEGVASLIRLATGDTDYTTGRVMGRTAQQLIPLSGALNFIDKIVDPTYRKSITVDEAIMAGIPGLSDNLKARQTSEGWDAKMSLWDVLTPYKIGTTVQQKEREYNERVDRLRRLAERRKEKASR